MMHRMDKRQYRSGGILLSILIALVCGFSPTLAQEIVPVMTDYFDTGSFGANLPDGITLIPATCNFAIVDSTVDKVFIVDALGILKNELSLTYDNDPRPSGIAYIPDSDTFAIVDDGADSVFIVNASGVLQNQFSVSTESTNPQGITYLDTSGNLAMVDATADKVFLFSLTGVFQSEFDLNYPDNKNPVPYGIQYLPATGNYALVDRTLDDILVINSAGIIQEQFDCGFVSASPSGITFDSCRGNFAVVDDGADEVFSINGEGTQSDQFGLTPIGLESPVGITFIPTTQNYAIVDDIGEELYVINSAGEKQSQCDISSFSTFATGITYISAGDFAGNFAITDNKSNARKLFITTPGCVLLHEYDLTTFGINSLLPTGVQYLQKTDSFAIMDSSRDAALFVKLSRPGRITGQMSTLAFTSNSPQDVTLIPAGGNFAVVDNIQDEVFIVDSKGIMRGRFDTADFASLDPRGIAFDYVNEKVAVVDKGGVKVTILDLPSLLDQLAKPNCKCDINDDGDVDGADLSEFTEEFGRDDCR